LPEEQAENTRYLYELASAMFGYDEALLEKVYRSHLRFSLRSLAQRPEDPLTLAT
jgi:hypothetical protein